MLGVLGHGQCIGQPANDGGLGLFPLLFPSAPRPSRLYSRGNRTFPASSGRLFKVPDCVRSFLNFLTFLVRRLPQQIPAKFGHWLCSLPTCRFKLMI